MNIQQIFPSGDGGDQKQSLKRKYWAEIHQVTQTRLQINDNVDCRMIKGTTVHRQFNLKVVPAVVAG